MNVHLEDTSKMLPRHQVVQLGHGKRLILSPLLLPLQRRSDSASLSVAAAEVPKSFQRSFFLWQVSLCTGIIFVKVNGQL